jgi:ABC-2 type transport system permease protein
MSRLIALFRREFLEHRGAFFYAPVALLAIFGCGLGLAIATNRLRFPGDVNAAIVLKVYQTGAVVLAEAWWVYLLVTLFFYYADSFSADRRNNAMLFWKSMPVSDFFMLVSKMLTGLILFPVIIYVFAIVSSVVLYLLAWAAKTALRGLVVPGPVWMVLTVQQIAWFELCQFVLGLLWYSPFFAWIGLLSTFFRRWSIPLSIAIPAILSLLENSAFYGQGPIGGYLWTYLSRRLQFGVSTDVWMASITGGVTANVPLLTTQLLASIDQVQLAGGVVVAVVLIYIASLYRRRGITA